MFTPKVYQLNKLQALPVHDRDTGRQILDSAIQAVAPSLDSIVEVVSQDLFAPVVLPDPFARFQHVNQHFDNIPASHRDVASPGFEMLTQCRDLWEALSWTAASNGSGLAG